MSQIYIYRHIYLCENIKKVGVKSLWEYKTGIFWAHFNNNSGIHLQNSLQNAIFGIFVLKFASYAHLIL